MPEHEVELSVGDVLKIGSYTVRVVEIRGDEVGVRIDSDAADEEMLLSAGGAAQSG